MSQTADLLRTRKVKCCRCKRHFRIDDTEILAVKTDPIDGHPICWYICKDCKGKKTLKVGREVTRDLKPISMDELELEQN